MGFIRLNDILAKVRARNPALNQRIKEARAVSLWDRAVGEAIARHARAIRVQDGVLWVEVDHPAWRSELHHRKRQILDILNEIPEEQGKEKQPPLKDLLFLDPRDSRKKS